MTFRNLAIFRVILVLVLMGTPLGDSAAQEKANDQKSGATKTDPEFLKKLALMNEKIEKSLKILREQIVQNQSAPFLADLFLQLGDLLAEKSNVLYYQMMERDKGLDKKIGEGDKLNPIVVAQQEAIGIYQKILKEFPSFDKRNRVLYRLALSQRAIEQSAGFEATVTKLIQDFPLSKEAMQGRVLLGQFYFDLHDLKKAEQILVPARDCSFPYERNAARYRLGLIAMGEEKFAEALGFFEKVALDEELKEDDQPLEVSLQGRGALVNLKREALIDSIRAFTEVHKKNVDPVAFYSRIAPTESLFQEVIEKLAYRYIFLKNESRAMKLLRVLSEREPDPQKVVNIYQEVLLLIAPAERIEVPFEEMEFVLTKYSQWLRFFEIPKKTKEESHKFFETQIREMGTKSHDIGKTELSRARKDKLFERARNFYHLYLGFFEASPQAVKVAINLADVYYYQKNFLKSGDYYLKVYQGKFGPPTTPETLLQNAILCFQQKSPNDFYEITRTKGLLVKAITSYMILKPEKKRDVKLNFLLARTYYDQGLYDRALNELLAFMKSYPKASNEVTSAADLILDYFNTRSDFKGLVVWSDKMMAIKGLPEPLYKRLTGVKSKAVLKKLDEEVKSKSGFDAFGQGKVYFETALSVSDEFLKSAALEQALSRSRSEKDINTFIKAAEAIAQAEKKPEKRIKIILAMGEETLAIGRFYQTLGIWQKVLRDPGSTPELKNKVKEKSIKLSLMLRDWQQLDVGLHGGSGALDESLRNSVNEQLARYLESPAQGVYPKLNQFLEQKLDADELLAFFKGRGKLSPELQKKIISKGQAQCGKGADRQPLCLWFRARKLASEVREFTLEAKKKGHSLQSIEPMAKRLNSIIEGSRIMGSSGDAPLDIFVSLQLVASYEAFGNFLLQISKTQPQVAEALKGKAQESLQNKKREQAQCQRIIAAAALVSPINQYCLNGEVPAWNQATTWPNVVRVSGSSGKDPSNEEISSLQRRIFADPKQKDPYLDLADKYYRLRYFHHATALASYAMSTFPEAKDEFGAILGCGLLELGLWVEASHVLRNSEDYKGLKTQCSSSLKSRMAR